jgi:MFS family permease
MPEKAMAPFAALSRSMTADISRTRVSAAVRDYCSFPPGRGFPGGDELRPAWLPVVLGAADWHERGSEVGQDTELGEDDGALRVAVDVLILPSSISQMPVRGRVHRFFAAGMVVFTLGSGACALSASAVELIAARAFQGVGGAMMSALALSILSQAYPGKARASAIGIWATCAGLGFGLCPVVGACCSACPDGRPSSGSTCRSAWPGSP